LPERAEAASSTGSGFQSGCAPDFERRVRALACANRALLVAYSHRTLIALRGYAAARAVLAHIEPLLALNVDKEARKDSLVISASAKALAAGATPGAAETRRLMDEARSIDREFLQRAAALPIGLMIRYEDIAATRRERIERLLAMARRILEIWRDGQGMRKVLRTAYERNVLEREVNALLRLYAQETHALSHSVRMPFFLAPLRDRMAASLNRIMQSAGASLARDLSRLIYEESRH
jgi:hypothetical protein